ncbi:MAG: FHA domain-containing protein, partial [Chloroflexota bacterium]
MTSISKTFFVFLLFLLLFGGAVTQAQDSTPTANPMDMGTLIVAVTGIVAMSVSVFVVWRSMQDPLTGVGENADMTKRQTQEMRVPRSEKKTSTAGVYTETASPRNAGGGGDGLGDDDASVLILILLESSSNWLKAPYQWEVLAEDTPFYIGSTMNRTSSMDLDIGIPDARVSGNHVRIDYNEDIGRFTFTDMGSFNGSDWDNDVMTPDRPYVLQPDFKKMLVVSHYYKFMVNTMGRSELDDLVYGDGTPFPMFLDDPEITEVLGSAEDSASPTFPPGNYEELVSNPVVNAMPAVTQSIPRDVTQQISNFDFDEIRYRSSVNVGERDPLAGVLPDPTPLPKNVDAYLIWHESEREDTKLTNTVLTIGSSENADITLKSEEVSDTHLILMWRDGAFLLMDVSREGTWLQKGRRQERRQMPTNQPEHLQAGVQYVLDVARSVGNFTFEYKEIADVSEDIIEIPSLPEGVTPYLHIVREEMSDHRREVTQLDNNITLGRYVDSKVLLVAETVSRSHAQIVWREDGFVIRDVNSRGGTKVNDTLLIENENLWLPLEANEIHR